MNTKAKRPRGRPRYPYDITRYHVTVPTNKLGRLREYIALLRKEALAEGQAKQKAGS